MAKGFINFPIFEKKDHFAKVDWLEKTPLPFQVYALNQMTEERYINVNHSNCLFFSFQFIIYLFIKIIIPLRRSHIKSSKKGYKHILLKVALSLFWILDFLTNENKLEKGNQMEGGNELEQGKMHNYWEGHRKGQYLETTYHILSIGPSFFFIYFIRLFHWLSQFSFNQGNHWMENKLFQLFNSKRISYIIYL